jgi:hypothetical protein
MTLEEFKADLNQSVGTTMAEIISSRYAKVFQQTTWQPIETAPKDGTYVLLTDGQVWDVAAWLRANLLPSSSAWVARFGCMVMFKPTHWHALPELPTAESGAVK